MENITTFTIKTFGCKSNQCDSQMLAGALEANGWEQLSESEDLNFIIINTCAVTAKATKKCQQGLRSLKRKLPHAKLIAYGCASRSPEDITKGTPVDLLITSKTIGAIAKEILNFNQENIPLDIVDSVFLPEKAPLCRTRAFIKIQDGCLNKCTYCIVWQLRPNLSSRSLESTLAQAETLAEQGFKEIVLTGIHIGAFEIEGKRGDSIPYLLQKLSAVPGIERIRLSSIEACEVTALLLETIANNNKICPHLALPLQSGDSNVLVRMGRKYNPQQFYDTVEKGRQVIPKLTITTDLIVGFPGESEEEFLASLDFIKRCEFLKVHLFPFSPRAGTPAFKMENQIPPDEIRRRMETAKQVCGQVRRNVLESFIGDQKQLLIESVKEGMASGFCENYIPLTIAQKDFQVNDICSTTINCASLNLS